MIKPTSETQQLNNNLNYWLNLMAKPNNLTTI
jgi:hypothetical protein